MVFCIEIDNEAISVDSSHLLFVLIVSLKRGNLENRHKKSKNSIREIKRVK